MGRAIYLKIILALSIFGTIYFRIYNNISNSKEFFWDSMVYYCGPITFNKTGNGYESLIQCSKELIDFKFVYLPIYLRLFNWDIFSPTFFKFFWICLITISIILIIFIIKKIYNQNSYLMTLLFSLFCLSGIPLYGYLSGNISNFLYIFTALGILMITSDKERKINVGLILIMLPSLFKIHMILYLFVGFAVISKINFKLFSLLFLTPFCFLFVNKYIYPEEFELLSLNIAILPYIGDMGTGSIQYINFIKSNVFQFGDAFKSGKHEWIVDLSLLNSKNFIIDYLIYLIILILVIYRIYCIRLVKLSKNISDDIRLKISIGLLATYLVIPRLKQYDTILCSVPLLYLVNSQYFISCITTSRFHIKSNYVIFFFNIIILGFYNIKGDNYFIYPIILIVFIISSRLRDNIYIKN